MNARMSFLVNFMYNLYFGVVASKRRLLGHGTFKPARQVYPEAGAKMQDKMVQERFMEGIMESKVYTKLCPVTL